MTKYCISCGEALNEAARFCGSCGAPVPAGETKAVYTPAPANSPIVPPTDDEVPFAPSDDMDAVQNGGRRINWLLIGGGAAILLLLLLYYLVFLRDDISSPGKAPAKTAFEAEEAIEIQFFAVADANIRDRATTVGTTILGKLPRGQAASGVMTRGEDGVTSWLKLAGDKGFIASSNLSEEEPPKIAKLLGDRIWKADKAMEIYAESAAGSVPIDTVKAGTPLTLFGLTANDYIEIKLRKGGVGYIVDGARIAEASLVKGPPIAISFNPASCNFGSELEGEFGKLNAKSKAAYRAIDQAEFATDEARDKALAGFEGKSYFQRLERSWNGVSVTGIAQHYESQSIYFADTPDKVLAAFRRAGHKIGRDGQFANIEIYAGIGATAGEGRKYGKTDLSCGV